MEYLKIYPDRLEQYEEVIADVENTGSDEEIMMTKAQLFDVFMAAMRYAFTDEEPNFSPRSYEGAEWRGWRSDINRADAKLTNMRELGAKGGKSKKTTGKSAETTLEEKPEPEASLDDVEATLEESTAEVSPNAKVNIKAKVNTKVNTNVNDKVNVKANANAPAASGDPVTIHPHEFKEIKNLSVENALQKLCDEFPDVRKVGFKVELRKDLEELGYEKVRWLLMEADKANSKPTLQFNFYNAVKVNRLTGAGPKKEEKKYGYIKRSPEDIERYSRAAVVEIEDDEEEVAS